MPMSKEELRAYPWIPQDFKDAIEYAIEQWLGVENEEGEMADYFRKVETSVLMDCDLSEPCSEDERDDMELKAVWFREGWVAFRDEYKPIQEQLRLI